jgi:hypothetical protein
MTARLDFLEEWIPERMDPGTIFMLAKQADIKQGRQAYVAVLSCPRCGAMGLITRPQLQGSEAMICGDEECSAEYCLREGVIEFRKPQ